MANGANDPIRPYFYAGNYEEAEKAVSKFGLRPHQWVYVQNAEDLVGHFRGHIYFVGGWKGRRKHITYRVIKVAKNRGFQFRIKYEGPPDEDALWAEQATKNAYS